MDKLREQFDGIAALRDMQIQQSLHYPTVQVTLDRERAGLSGVTARDIGQSLIAATYSSRYTARNFWRDDVSGNSYQVQVEVPQPRMTEATDVELVPLTTQANRQQAAQVADSPSNPTPPLLIRDVARVMRSEMPGEVDRYNMRRYLSLTANIEGEDLGRVITPNGRGDGSRRPTAAGDRGRAARASPADAGDVSQPGDRPGRGRGRDPDHADRLFSGPAAGRDGRRVGAGGPLRRRAGPLDHEHNPQHRVVHGGDHGGRRGGLQRDHAGQLRRPPPPRGRDAGRPRGHHRRQRAGCGRSS